MVFSGVDFLNHSSDPNASSDWDEDDLGKTRRFLVEVFGLEKHLSGLGTYCRDPAYGDFGAIKCQDLAITLHKINLFHESMTVDHSFGPLDW